MKKYTVSKSQVVATKRGWLTLQLSDDTTVKARASQVQFVEEGQALSRRRIGNRRHDCTAYVRDRSAAGHSTLHNGDEIAVKLQGKVLDQVYKLAAKVLAEDENELRARYKHLNVGMQRMNLGNRIRGAQA